MANIYICCLSVLSGFVTVPGDKFTFVALFHTRQTVSSTLVHPLPLSPLLQCWTRVQAISPEFQHCIGGGVGGEATHFKTDNSAF